MKFQGLLKSVLSVFQQIYKKFQESFDEILFCNFVLSGISSQLSKLKDGMICLITPAILTCPQRIHSSHCEFQNYCSTIITNLGRIHTDWTRLLLSYQITKIMLLWIRALKSDDIRICSSPILYSSLTLNRTIWGAGFLHLTTKISSEKKHLRPRGPSAYAQL